MTDLLTPKVERNFQVKIASSGAVFDIPTDQSILEVLGDHHIDIESSCTNGLCATCMTGYLEGEPDHRDEVLESDERMTHLCVCISRSHSDLLVLDL